MYRKIKNVLIVEDTLDILDLVGRFVESVDLVVFKAKDGIDATQILEAQEIDVIITDFRMPRMDGIELLSWCRARQLHLPVIFTSADKQLPKREQIALNDCCATLIRKPLDFQILRSALEAADARTHHKDCLHQPVEMHQSIGSWYKSPSSQS